MKKFVKRFTVAIIVAMMAVITIPFSVAAADDTYTVYVDVPATWGIPNIWAWTDGGGNVYDSWPGEPMEAGDDGLYVAELPITALNFLINYNGDANKTRDIKVTGADCKVKINDDLSVSLEYLESPEETEPEETVKEEETTVKQETPTEQPTQATAPTSNGLGPEGAIVIVAVVVVIIIVGAIIFVVFKKQ